MAMDWKITNQEFKRELNEGTQQLSLLLKKIIPLALEEEGFKGDFGMTTDRLISEVAYRAQMDLLKISLYQSNDIDINKMVAYLCFWIRKVKPIPVYPVTNGKAILDINERLSLWLMSALITRMHKKMDPSQASNLAQRFKAFFSNESLFEYTVHSLRYRTFGPHHYVIFMKMITEM